MPIGTALTIKQHDTRPIWEIPDGLTQTIDGVEGPVDLTNVTAMRFIMRKVGNTAATKVDAAADFTAALGGAVSYTWATGDTDENGDFDVEVEATYNDGGLQTFPGNDYWR